MVGWVVVDAAVALSHSVVAATEDLKLPTQTCEMKGASGEQRRNWGEYGTVSRCFGSHRWL